jgi:hypothetical protein
MNTAIRPVGPQRGSNGPIFLVAALCLSLIAIIAFFGIKSRQNIPVDDETLCPEPKNISELVVVLLDISESLNEKQRVGIENELKRIRRGIPRFGLMQVYLIQQDRASLAKPVLHLCNPGDGSDMSEIYQNPALAKRRWLEFDRKVNQTIDSLLTLPDTQVSPIFETIQSIALLAHNSPDFDCIPEKRLIVVSDLIQNVPQFSQYEQTMGYDEFTKLDYSKTIKSDLTDVLVSILYVVRSVPAQEWPRHYRFWEDFFRDQGGVVEKLTPIYG